MNESSFNLMLYVLDVRNLRTPSIPDGDGVFPIHRRGHTTKMQREEVRKQKEKETREHPQAECLSSSKCVCQICVQILSFNIYFQAYYQ